MQLLRLSKIITSIHVTVDKVTSLPHELEAPRTFTSYCTPNVPNYKTASHKTMANLLELRGPNI